MRRSAGSTAPPGKTYLPGMNLWRSWRLPISTRGAPRVLMGKRHDRHKFMPGKYVFPGGAVEPADRRMSAAGALDAVVEAKLLAQTRRSSPGFARALALAAVRETFE